MTKVDRVRVLIGTALLASLPGIGVGSSAPAPLWPLTGVTLVSSTTTGKLGDGASGSPAVSADGHQVAFETKAKNLVRDRGKAFQQIVVRDLTTGAIKLVSADADDDIGNGASADPSISDNGRFIAFSSAATNLAPKLSGHRTRIFVKDTKSGEISHISTKGHSGDANASSSSPAISGNAAVVVFASQASNLTANCRGTGLKVFARNRRGGAVSCVSTTAGDAAADGQSDLPSISKSGRYVAFQSSASNLDAACSGLQIYLKDRSGGGISCVSTAADGTVANAASSIAAISATGGFVAFQSKATNLDAACANGHSNIFVKNIQTGEVKCASRNGAGSVGNGESTAAALSSDGTIVAFQSIANNLVTGDANAKADVFVKNLETGEIARVSSPQQSGLEANGRSRDTTITADGQYVAFGSDATNLVNAENNHGGDVFITRTAVFHAVIKKITRISIAGSVLAKGRAVIRLAPADAQANGYSGMEFIQMADDSQAVSFSTTANNLSTGCPQQGPDSAVYLSKDLATGDVTCTVHAADAQTASFRISADGRFEVFSSTATDIDPACFRTQNIFLRDNADGSVRCVSTNGIGAHGNEDSYSPSISPDGTKVLFASKSTNFVAGAHAGWPMLYMKDLNTNQLSFAGADKEGKLPGLNEFLAAYPRFSADGGSILFSTDNWESNVDARLIGVFVKDLTTSELKLITENFFSNTYLSRNWRYVVSHDDAAQGCAKPGIMIYDLTTDTRKCASTNSAGDEANNVSTIFVPSQHQGGHWTNPVISDDGRYVVFTSLADNLVPEDRNLCDDVFVKDMVTGAIARVSVSAEGLDGIDNSYGPSISADGRYVMFGSFANNLVPNDTQSCGTANCPDVFLTPNPLFQ